MLDHMKSPGTPALLVWRPGPLDLVLPLWLLHTLAEALGASGPCTRAEKQLFSRSQFGMLPSSWYSPHFRIYIV